MYNLNVAPCPETPDKLDVPLQCQAYPAVTLGGCDAYVIIGFGRGVDTSNQCIYERETGKYLGQTYWNPIGPQCLLEPDASVPLNESGTAICSGRIDDAYLCIEDGGVSGGRKAWDAAADASGDAALHDAAPTDATVRDDAATDTGVNDGAAGGDGSWGYDGATIDN